MGLFTVPTSVQTITPLVGQIQIESESLRQSGIDEELFDVISGFEALSGEAR